MLGVFGFIILISIMVILFWGKFTPSVAFIMVPVFFGLLLGYNPVELGGFIHSGIGTTVNTATLFIFSIPFFVIMNEAGVLDPITNKLVAMAKGNTVRVTVFTVILTVVVHLDGAGASTALIVIPAMLPIYKALNMRPHVLLLLMSMAAGTMNIIPWGGPTLRAASVMGMDANEIWHRLIPIQGFVLLISLALAVFMGIRERKFADVAIEWYSKYSPTKEGKKVEGKKELPKWKFYVNLALIIFTISLLVWGAINATVVFMFSTSLALVLNFSTLKEQNRILDISAKGCLPVVTVLLASGAMIGVLEHTGMMDAMGVMILGFIPASLGGIYNLVIAFLAAPIAVIFGTDPYFFGLLPLIATVGESLGFEAVVFANIFVLGHNLTVYASPFTPVMFLMAGLAGVEVKEHLKFTLPWAIGISWVTMLFAAMIGII